LAKIVAINLQIVSVEIIEFSDSKKENEVGLKKKKYFW